jgi:hypothetical protein
MAEFLRSNGYHVVVTASLHNAEEIMSAREYPFVGLVAVLEGGDPELENLLGTARIQKPPLRTVLQIVGRNQDELPSDLLEVADLVIAADMPQASILEHLESMFDPQAAAAL